MTRPTPERLKEIRGPDWKVADLADIREELLQEIDHLNAQIAAMERVVEAVKEWQACDDARWDDTVQPALDALERNGK